MLRDLKRQRARYKLGSYPEGQLELDGGLLLLEGRVLGEDDLLNGLTGVALPGKVRVKSWLEDRHFITIRQVPTC